MGHVTGVNFFLISQSPTSNIVPLKEAFTTKAFGGMYKDYYYKMMTFQNRVWVENDFGGPIFWIFHFQNSPPIWDMWRVENFFKKTNSLVWDCVGTLTTVSDLRTPEAVSTQYGLEAQLKLFNIEYENPIWGQNVWIFHSQKHPPFTLK